MNAHSRRDFLKYTVVAGALARFAALRGEAQPADVIPSSRAASTGTAPDWWQRPMRFANLTLVDDDPGKFDPQFWIDYFARIKADCATLSAGGYLAFYPTDIPLHRRSANLGTKDPYGELYQGARKLGMNVIARIDPHACRDEVRAAHPDWISTDARGEPRRHHGLSELWITCALGPYHFEFMRSVIRELVSLYPVDAVFSNRWNGLGWCYCPNCQRNFREATGLEIPPTESEEEPNRAAFIAWQQQRLFELWTLWDETVRAENPNAFFIPNMGAGIWEFLDMAEIGRRAKLLFADRQGRTGAATNSGGVTAPWAIGRAGKEFRAVMGRKPVGAGYSVGVEEPYRWKDSFQSEAEQRVWMADGIANGLLLSFGKTGGRIGDPRWLEFTAELFQWHHRHEKYLRNTRSLAQVAVIYSQQSATTYGRPWRRDEDPTMRHYQAFVETTYQPGDHASGMYHALIENRIPFEMVCDRLLTAEALSRYRVVVLPNCSVLDDEKCAVLTEFVKQGGSLLATYETSLHDGNAPRANFGLAELFGAKFVSANEHGAMNSYVEFDRSAPGAKEILEGFTGVPRMIGGVWYLNVESREADAHPVLTRIPDYPHLPMEEVYSRTSQRGPGQLFLRQVGAGRVAYFPWDIDRLFWETLLEDHGRLIANTVRWALNETPVVTVQGGGLLDVVPWQQESTLAVHLVNLTNPYAMKGPFRELVPVGPHEVRLQLPPAATIARVHLLVSDVEPRWKTETGALVVHVPTILDREVIAVDFREKLPLS